MAQFKSSEDYRSFDHAVRRELRYVRGTEHEEFLQAVLETGVRRQLPEQYDLFVAGDDAHETHSLAPGVAGSSAVPARPGDRRHPAAATLGVAFVEPPLLGLERTRFWRRQLREPGGRGLPKNFGSTPCTPRWPL